MPRMRGTTLALCLAALLAVPSTAAAGTRTINFDDLAGASCAFTSSDGPLRDRYAASMGVTFRGPAPNDGGAILADNGSCGSFGVTGHSPPNFLAFNTAVAYTPAQGGGVPRGPETIGFHRAVHSVSVKAGQGSGGTVTVTAFNASTPVASSFRTSTPAAQTLTVSAERITSVQLSFTGSAVIFDDLTWANTPVAPGESYSTTEGSALSVPASQGVLRNDSDADGDALVAQLAHAPGNGTLDLRPDGSFTYTPRAGFSGSDFFGYRASDGGGRSPEATVTLRVEPLPPPPPPPPPPPTLIPSTLTNSWLVFPAGFTRATSLVVNDVLAGSTVRVTCKAKPRKRQKKICPYKRKTVKTATARRRLNLRKPFRKKKLRPGTVVTVTITAPNRIGKQFRYTIRRKTTPRKSLRCIPPGGKPGRCT